MASCVAKAFYQAYLLKLILIYQNKHSTTTVTYFTYLIVPYFIIAAIIDTSDYTSASSYSTKDL